MKLILSALILLTACVQDNLSPESALQTFVEARIGNVVTRDYVLSRVTGKMKQSLENISDEEFNKFADLRDVKRNSFKILTRSCDEKKCFITYSLAYATKQEGLTAFTSEVKKIAEIVNENGKWLISDVSNIKTYHEAIESINP
jgi:hypothetical protein